MNAVYRHEYVTFYKQTTRWRDNDVYGHINNVVYYSYFDSAVNRYLTQECGLDIASSAVVGFVVASACTYHSPLAYPVDLEVGIRVNRLGNKSVEYGIAVFEKGADKASADGTFTHVFVDRQQGQSVEMPSQIRMGLKKILV